MHHHRAQHFVESKNVADVWIVLQRYRGIVHVRERLAAVAKDAVFSPIRVAARSPPLRRDACDGFDHAAPPCTNSAASALVSGPAKPQNAWTTRRPTRGARHCRNLGAPFGPSS